MTSAEACFRNSLPGTVSRASCAVLQALLSVYEAARHPTHQGPLEQRSRTHPLKASKLLPLFAVTHEEDTQSLDVWLYSVNSSRAPESLMQLLTNFRVCPCAFVAIGRQLRPELPWTIKVPPEETFCRCTTCAKHNALTDSATFFVGVKQPLPLQAQHGMVT